MTQYSDLLPLLERIAKILERMCPEPLSGNDVSAADAFIWIAESQNLEPVKNVNRIELKHLIGVDRAREILIENTRRHAEGYPANNALLWGARGMGKSSLIKAVHAAINCDTPAALALIEIDREDIDSLPRLLQALRSSDRRFILFCDDLSFDGGDTSYKSLKGVLEGGIQGRPNNVILYATSNRRHLMPRDMIENESSTAIHPSESVDEKVSISDRFGLWLGFHPCSQDDYFSIVENYASSYGIKLSQEEIRSQALEWSVMRGARSGRVAWQFIQDLAGRHFIRMN